MKLSFEILDYVFSFLVSHRDTLIDCSRDPILFPLVERHLYYSVGVYFDDRGTLWKDGPNTPSHHYGPVALSRTISKNPRIPHYVRILQIHVRLRYDIPDICIKERLDAFAETLLTFPALECIKLITSSEQLFIWPDGFRAALEDRFNLPTLQELHIQGNQEYPCSLIDTHKNIKNLSVSGESVDANHSCGSNLPQLKSLRALRQAGYCSTLKSHVSELQSLKCASSALQDLPELLEVCSQTLKKLDIDLLYSQFPTIYLFYTRKVFWPGDFYDQPFPGLSSIPPHLEQLTIHAPIDVDNEAKSDEEHQHRRRTSHLPAAARIISLVVPPPQHLILDIDISLARTASNLDEVDFAALAVLGPASLSILRIDLYVHTDQLASADTRAQFLSSLADYDDVLESIKDGTIVVHSEETAPDYEELSS